MMGVTGLFSYFKLELKTLTILYQAKKWIFSSLTSVALLSSTCVLPAYAERARMPLAGALQSGAPISFADLIEEVSPAVVSINVVTDTDPRASVSKGFENLPKELQEFLDNQMPGFRIPKARPHKGRALGSGFLISGKGYIVTNHHVVENASKITVQFQDGNEFDAHLVGSDKRTDLAVLKIKGDKEFPHVEFAEGINLRVGDWVVAVGNPFGLGGTATAGIVSATGREVGPSAYDFIQVDASINQGNSGGPTFDLYGNVVGVNAQILSPTGGNIGIGFAIPARIAAKVTQELIKNGAVTRGWLGVQVQAVTKDIADSEGLPAPKGALVAEVVKGGPAEKAGMKDGDIILKMDGKDVTDQRDLTRGIGEMFVGHNAKFVVLRDGKKKSLRVKIGKRDEEALRNSTPASVAPKEFNEFGLKLGELDDETRKNLGIRGNRGLLIEGIEPDSAASRKGLRAGDAIISAGGMNVQSRREFDAVVKKARSRGVKAIRLLVRTSLGQKFIALRLDTE